jgi:hypothetical protein
MAVLTAQGCTFTLLDLTDPIRVARAVGGMKSFQGLDGEATDKDRTTLGSAAREFAQGLLDGGKFSIELFRLPADVGQVAALALKAAQASSTGVLTLASGDICTFPCYVKSLTAGGQNDQDHMGTLNVKVAGEPVWS